MADNQDAQNSPAGDDDAGVARLVSSPEGLTFDGAKVTNEGKARENDEDGASQTAPEPGPLVFAPVVVLWSNEVHGPLGCVLDFMGQGCELCLALTCRGALEAVSQRKGGMSLRRPLYFMSTPSLCTFAADSLGLVAVKKVCTLAAKHGLLAALKILRGRGCDWGADMCTTAAKGGHLDVLKWLRLPEKPEGQCDWDEYTCMWAANGGHLEMLKWLRRPGEPEGQCDWDWRTCSDAAQGGHLEVLKWLRLPGKPEG